MIARFPPDVFLRERFDPAPGEHISIIGPTGSGKTHLSLKIVNEIARPSYLPIVLVAKPRDTTVKRFANQAHFKITRSWPPPLINNNLTTAPRGWIVWPKFTFDPDRDDFRMHDLYRNVILRSYRKGNRLIVVDEVYALAKELGLSKELVTLWSRGRSMGVGLLAATQRPAYVPLWMYSQAEHLFLARDPDKRSRDRYRDIGGIDPRTIEQTTEQLNKFEWLYIRRTGPTAAIIEAGT